MDKEIGRAGDFLRLPDRYVEAKVDSRTDPTVREIITAYSDNFDSYAKEGIAPAFFGAQGAGKTHAAAALSRLLASKGHLVYWAPTIHKFNVALDFRDFRDPQYWQQMDKLYNAPILVLDDFGQLRDYNRIRELFFQVVDYRYSWKRPTIFTANFNIMTDEDWEVQIGSCFNAALARRVKAMSDGLVYNAR